MNLSILFEKDDFDDDATFLKIESKISYNQLLIEVVLNNKRWFYDHMEMSSTGMMTDEIISLEELLPYEIQSELYEDPEKNKPYALNLNVKLIVDKKVIDSQFSRLYLKKSKDNILTTDGLDFRPVFFLDSVTDFDENVNATILSDIREISNPDSLRNIDELEIQIVAIQKIKDVEVKLDMFADYEKIIDLATPIAINEILGNDQKYVSTIRLNGNLFELLDNNISYEISKKQQLILYTEIIYTEVDTQEKRHRIQSHIIHNPWCAIMEKKVEKHIEVLKNVLNAEFPSWTGEVKDNEMWTSFRIHDDEFQYGLKDGKIDIHLYFGEISYDHDFEEVFAEMQKVNKTLDKKVQMIETDNYFNLKAQISPSKLTVAGLTAYIQKMIAITELPAVDRLLGTYQEY
ncbi:hypothetical protein [uncultured Kordia sp.]|uniref:hypothetical protein n=1 Tax=uncultured Kordia sp. TaxID=507699 RepID=UPI0026320380|nr:hypothetical protein [uncultured Kordia sp.]